MLSELDAWGVLPVALFCLLVSAALFARWLLPVVPNGPSRYRAAAAVVLAMGLVHASVGALGELGALDARSLGVVLVVALGGSWWLSRPSRSAVKAELSYLARLAVESPVATAAVLVTLAVAVVTARIMPVWQWDSFGYHLPLVNLVLQHRGFGALPEDLRYVTTYPHNIELGMVWLRAFLPDDRLVDLAQVPYGVGAALLTMCTARELGASRRGALLAGAAWLAVPVVFLQLPTNYVDVGTAAALLGALFFLLVAPMERTHLFLGGLALGLFLGSKPAAPLAVAFIAVVALVRAWRSGRSTSMLGALGLTLVFGAQQYAVMWVRHGNPVWPVAVKVGPLSLPGTEQVGDLLAAGAAVPHATGSLLERLSVSWFAVGTTPAFDMKLGGLGVLFVLALPLALLALLRARSVLVAAAVLAACLSPDPSLARYVLALPALVFALAATLVEPATSPQRPHSFGLATVVALLAMGWQVQHAWPGLVGDGPAWEALVEMNDAQRRVAVGPAGRTDAYETVWSGVAAGESVLFDADFEFPGLLWNAELSYPVKALPRPASARELDAVLRDDNVRFAAIGPHHAELLARRGDWEKLFDCTSADCAVWVRRDTLISSSASAPAAPTAGR